MNRRQLVYSALVAFVLALLSIFFFDQPIAAFVHRVGGRQSAILQGGTHWLEIAFGLTLQQRYLLSYLLLGLAAILFLAKNTRAIAWILLFVGSAQLVTRLTAGTLKGVFQRLRPFEVIQAGNWDWKFFAGHGSSFPSGHSAFFWGAVFPARLSLSALSYSAPHHPGLHHHRARGRERSLVQRRPRFRRHRGPPNEHTLVAVSDEADHGVASSGERG